MDWPVSPQSVPAMQTHNSTDGTKKTCKHTDLSESG
jgi:hypothetical protein